MPPLSFERGYCDARVTAQDMTVDEIFNSIRLNPREDDYDEGWIGGMLAHLRKLGWMQDQIDAVLYHDASAT